VVSAYENIKDISEKENISFREAGYKIALEKISNSAK
jgi:hypothetical protein